MKIKLRLPDEIVLPLLSLAPQRVISDQHARLANGEVNRKPHIATGSIILSTKGFEVELDTDVPNADKGIYLVACMGADGRWQYFDQDGDRLTWHDAVAEYLALFGKQEQPPDADDALPDTDPFTDQLTEDTDDQIVTTTTLVKRTSPVTQKHFIEQLAGGGGTVSIGARGTGHTKTPGEK